MKLNLIAIPLAVGIAVSIAIPALGSVQWKYMNSGYKGFYSDQVKGGTSGGTTLYVCKAIHKGEYTPGRLSYRHICSIPWGNKEYFYKEYRVLTGNNWRWVDEEIYSGRPSNAVPGGTQNGNPLYVCRAVIDAEYTPGKYYPQTGTCYVPWGNLEYRYTKNFDFLVVD